MKSITNIAGILLILFGIISLGYGHLSYSSQEEVVKVGDLKITAQTDKNVNLPPFLGGLCLAAGVGLLVLDRFRKR